MNIFTSFIFVSSLFLSREITAQNYFCSTKVLYKNEIAELFSDSLKNKFNIEYNIYRIYECIDKLGKSYILLTEKNDSINSKGDTLNKKIKAFKISSTKKGFVKIWELQDQVITQLSESTIWFWTKYCTFYDVDHDGQIDPIIVLGSTGINGYYDGRVNIITCHLGKRIFLRHQNGPLDHERKTQVDVAFYSLPTSIQNKVKLIMENIVENGQAIFPYGWQNAMKKKQIKIDELK